MTLKKKLIIGLSPLILMAAIGVGLAFWISGDKSQKNGKSRSVHG